MEEKCAISSFSRGKKADARGEIPSNVPVVLGNRNNFKQIDYRISTWAQQWAQRHNSISSSKNKLCENCMLHGHGRCHELPTSAWASQKRRLQLDFGLIVSASKSHNTWAYRRRASKRNRKSKEQWSMNKNNVHSAHIGAMQEYNEFFFCFCLPIKINK